MSDAKPCSESLEGAGGRFTYRTRVTLCIAIFDTKDIDGKMVMLSA
jgi:hypothetical protein